MKKVTMKEFWEIMRELPSAYGETYPQAYPHGSVFRKLVCPKCRGTMYDITVQVDDPKKIESNSGQVRKCQNCGQEYAVLFGDLGL
jgi:uncharacterized protein with PIN domain